MRQLAHGLGALLVLPAPPGPEGGRLRWILQALTGVPSRRRSDGTPRPWLLWLARLAQGLLVRTALLLLVAGLLIVFLVRGSLPRLDGELHVAGLSAPVRIERDALGVPTIHAASRADLACGLGFVHGQDRYFQMDGLRRYAAGELAALVGPAMLELDRRNRLHRFRDLARRAARRLQGKQRAELDAYVRGVNAGLDSLRVRPFEYLVLRTAPEPWTAEDSVLVMLSMFLMLQERNVEVESALGVARETLPPDLYRLLAAPGDEWDAPLEGPAYETPPLPGPEVFDLRKEPPLPEDRATTGTNRPEPVAPGSNSWAVAGKQTVHGGALLANDMHLGLRLPNIWYRAGLVWPGGRAWGATLAGGPGLIIGSNGHVAWGMTNTEGDWSDLVRLEIEPTVPGRYRTPDGPRPFETHDEWIHVRGEADVFRPVRQTCWGPVLDDTDYHRQHPHALHWLAHDVELFNMNYLELLEARSLDEVLATAVRTAGPQVNFLAADEHGDIGWTVYGRLPRRVGFDGRTPTSWADGKRRWDGYLDPKEAPRIVRPESGRLWTANNRLVDGGKLAPLGVGGYARGARAGQIRDRLRARDRLSEADMLQIQLDDRALFLERWQRLLLTVLAGPWADSDPGRVELRRLVTDWGGRAAHGSVGYRMVHDFRLRVSKAVLAPLTARCRAVDPTIGADLFRSQEGPVWRILQERPAHLLDPRHASWDDLLHAAVDNVLKTAREAGPNLAERTWGERNPLRIRHPLSAGLRGVPLAGPLLVGWLDLDMPAEPIDGGWSDLPRVHHTGFGASQRMAVSPGREALGYFHMPGGQSGHPLSPHYRDGQDAWVRGLPSAFLPGETVHVLTLK
jgi:penicillin amidase